MLNAIGSHSSDHCSLLIPAPSDAVVYRCFQSIARQWKQQLTSETLLIEGDVLMASGLTHAQAPSGIIKILEANLNVVMSIHLSFGGLSVKFARANEASSRANRKNYFDEITISLEGFCTLSQAEIGQLILLLSTCLRVSAARASAAFNEFTEDLPIRVRHVHGEHRT